MTGSKTDFPGFAQGSRGGSGSKDECEPRAAEPPIGEDHLSTIRLNGGRTKLIRQCIAVEKRFVIRDSNAIVRDRFHEELLVTLIFDPSVIGATAGRSALLNLAVRLELRHCDTGQIVSVGSVEIETFQAKVEATLPLRNYVVAGYMRQLRVENSGT